MIRQHLRKKLIKALDREETHSIEDIEKLIDEGKAFLFQNHKAVFIIEVLHFPKKKVLNAWLGAGCLEGIHELTPMIEDFGRKQGCIEIQMTGRKGWKRILSDAAMTNIVLKRPL